MSLALPGGCLQVGLDGQGLEIEGFGPRRFAGGRSAVACCRDFMARGTGKTPAAPAGGRQTRAGRGGGTHRRDLRRPKGPDVSVLASSSSTCMINSPIASWRSRPDRPCALKASIPAIAFSRHCSTKSPRPTAATKVPPARHAKAAGQPHALRVTDRWPSPQQTWPGENVDERRLPQAQSEHFGDS